VLFNSEVNKSDWSVRFIFKCYSIVKWKSQIEVFILNQSIIA
jgi:hypothetical protein